MKITINNKENDTQSVNLSQLADELALPATGVAVAINNKMVPRTDWESTTLAENDSIVIIKAACGG